MLQRSGGPRALTTAQLMQALPEVRDLLAEDREYQWASEANSSRVGNELEAARLAESMGYYHRVELHCKRAIEIFKQDLARNANRREQRDYGGR